MKALVFAAGRGERLAPITLETPKALVEVGGRALIEHHLLALHAASIREVVINISWLRDKIRQRLGDGARYGLHIQYSDEGDQALETGGGMRAALPLLGTTPFVLVNADVRTDYDFSRLGGHALSGLAHLVMVDPPPGARGDFAPDGDKLRPLSANQHGLTYSGIGLYDPALVASHDPGVFKLAPLLSAAMAAGQISHEHHRGRWIDVGTPERLSLARAWT